MAERDVNHSTCLDFLAALDAKSSLNVVAISTDPLGFFFASPFLTVRVRGRAGTFEVVEDRTNLSFPSGLERTVVYRQVVLL